MATYQYAKTDGSLGTFEAADDAMAGQSASQQAGADATTGAMRYTDPTPVAPIVPAPTPGNDTDDSDDRVNRYTSSGSTKIPEVAKVDESKIRDTARQQAQAQIDAINELSATEYASASRNAVQRLGETRARNANTGLIGSGTGDAFTEKTRGVNMAELAEVNARKAQRISSVLAGVNSRADSLIQNARTSARMDADTQRTYLKEQAEQARDDFKSLATMGAELTTQQKRRLIEQTGYDEDTFDQIYKSLKIVNGNYINKDKPQIVGNKAVFFKMNDDGSISTDEVDLPTDSTGRTVATAQGIMAEQTDGTWVKIGDRAPTAAQINAGIGGGGTAATLGEYPPDIQAAAQSILDGKSKLNEYPSAKRLQINAAMSKVYQAEGGNELAQGAYDSAVALSTNPGFKAAIGTNILLGYGKNISGSPAAGFLAELDKLKANLKLVNVKYLKGTGALSDAEGKTLEDASTSLSPQLPEAQFTKELKRVTDALAKAKGVAPVFSADPSLSDGSEGGFDQAAAAAVGSVVTIDGKTYKKTGADSYEPQ